MRIAIRLVLAGAVLAGARPLTAQSGALLTYANHCVLPWEGLAPQKVAVRVGSCTQSGARYIIQNGIVRTGDNLCMDHSVAYGMTPSASNDGVVFVPCTGGASQTWYFIRNGLAQNKANTAVCLDIENGNDAAGTRLIVWPCDYRDAAQTTSCAKYNTYCPRANQRFFIGAGGVSMSALTTAGMPSDAAQRVAAGYGVTFNTGLRVVAGGAGNIVAAGGGNIIAAGGGNIIAAGGGNLINGTVSNIVATDGATFSTVLNLIGQDGTSLKYSVANGGAYRLTY